MPMERERYPHDWEEISLRLREATPYCQECNVPNHIRIRRLKDDPFIWRRPELIPERVSHLWREKSSLVILTVHHKGVDYPDGRKGDRHDKMDNRPENLAVLCQRCHFLADFDIHQAKSKETRERKRHESHIK